MEKIIEEKKLGQNKKELIQEKIRKASLYWKNYKPQEKKPNRVYNWNCDKFYD